MSTLHKIIQFVTTDIWHIESKNTSWSKSFFLRQLRVIILAFRGFKEDKLQLRASALTLYSMLAIVPVLAMVFAVAKGFGFDALLQDQLLERFPGQQEILVKALAFARTLLAKTRGGLIAGIGISFSIGPSSRFWAISNNRSTIFGMSPRPGPYGENSVIT